MAQHQDRRDKGGAVNITPHITPPLRLGWNQARITVTLSILLVVTALAVLIYTLAEVLP